MLRKSEKRKRETREINENRENMPSRDFRLFRVFRVQLLLIFSIIVVLAGCWSSDHNVANSSATPTSSASPSSSYDPILTDLNRVKQGAFAPDFELEDINGKKIRLSDYRGQKYVVMVFYRGYF